MSGEQLELRTQELGREVFARVAADRPSLASSAWWDDRLMSLSMRDEQVKTQLFRFVDVLPTLKSSAQVNRHLREYFLSVQEHLPFPLRRMVGWIPENGRAGGMLAGLARSNAHRFARRFIAGSTLDETVKTLVGLRRRSRGFTIDLLGEAVLTEAEATQYQQEYLRLIEGLSERAREWPGNPLIDRDHRGPIPRVNVSVKLSSLYSQFDPMDPEGTARAVEDRLRPILRLAKSRGAFVHVDMEQYAYKDVTLRIFKEVMGEDEFRDWADVGIVIQTYLKSAEEDLRGLLRWVEQRGTSVWVRLVKGAYWDYETIIAAQQGWPAPVFTQKPQTDACYEALTGLLLEHHGLLRPAIASHNIRSIGRAMALAEQLGLPKGSIEFQTLYGMADALKTALVNMGQRVRVYTPFGQLLPGMGYLVRRLLENTSNTSFLRAGFLEHVPMEQLLMNPLELLKRPGKAAKPADGKGPAAREALEHPFVNEALADFSQEPARRAMEGALREAAGRLNEAYPLVIGGRHTFSAKQIDSLNPSHQSQVVGRCASASAEDTVRAVEAAKEAFSAWRDLPADVRASYLFRTADVLRRRRYELAAWETYECGKQWRESDADVAEAIDYCDYYAREMLRLSHPQHRDVPGEENAYFYEPRGVVAVIAPWNFPLAILCGMTTAALATGNTAVMKPAAQSPVIAAKLMEAFEEAGIPPGVVNYLPGSGSEIGPVLVGHPDVSLIAFTGSREVGLSILKQASEVPAGQEHLKHAITELGGKNAVIVDDDADLDEALKGVAFSAFGYSGQKCSACSRVIVLDGIYDAFVARLIEVTRSLKVGPAENPGAFVGPVIDQRARQRILEYIEAGKKEARLAYAGELGGLADEGFYVAPHIFADVPPEATIAQEEIFGPVLAVMRAGDLSEALEIANGTKYALTGGLYSRSPDNIARVRREFRVGNLYINRKITGALVDRQPFGGFKLSGGGTKAGGPDYLLHFVWPRTVTENTLRRGFAPAVDDLAEPTGVGE